MSIDPTNWQLEQGGVLVGENTSVDLTSLSHPTWETRSQDIPAVRADARIFGRDRRTPGVWSMVMSINAAGENEALQALEDLSMAWDDPEVRETPGLVVPLRYQIGDRPARRVYGRTRHFSPTLDNLIFGQVPIAYSFDLAHTGTFSDQWQSTGELRVGVADLTGSGVVFPTTLPRLWGGTEGAPQSEQIRVGGRLPTWLQAEITGPIWNPYLVVDGLTYALSGGIPADTTVRVSSMPWDQGVFRADGSAADLHPEAPMGHLRVKPGAHQITFGGIDNTGQAKAIVSWPDHFPSL